MPDAEKKTARVSIATGKSVVERLATCADRTRLPQSLIAEGAIQAIVEAIEKHGYRVVFPVQFNVAYVPVAISGKARGLPPPDGPRDYTEYPVTIAEQAALQARMQKHMDGETQSGSKTAGPRKTSRAPKKPGKQG